MLWSYLKFNMLRNPFQVLYNAVENVTYYELVNMAEQFGAKLNHKKYGILCKSDLNAAKAILACVAAGVTAVPLSNRYGKEQNQRMIRSIKVSHMIEDGEDGLVVRETGEEGKEAEELKDVVFILCTSGSTGKPKGVMVTEENLLANLSDSNHFYIINNKDKVMASRGLYHCSAITGDLFMSLMRGAAIYFYEGRFDAGIILGQMEKEQITAYSGTPTVFYYLCDMLCRREKKLLLRFCSIGGECMTGSVVKMLRKGMPNVRFVHSYGLTETCSRATFLWLDQSLKEADCVGKPLASMSVRIVDEEGEVLKPYQEGELHMRGLSIMKGYYGDMDGTKRSHSGGWFCTGDMAYIDEDGMIHIKGRKDDMIIRAGVNIYPQDIENVLIEDERIRNARVYGERGDAVTDGMIALVVPESGCKENLSKKTVMEICQRRLPLHQIPDEVRIVSELRFSHTGKVIRK